MHSSQRTPKCPSQRGQGEGWGPGCRDGGGVGGEVSQVTDRNRPRISPKDLPLSSRGLRGEGQLEAECAHRAWPSAERMQTQASWCGPEAVLPITCFPGLLSRRTEDLGSVCLMFNQLSLLGLFPLWEGSNSRIFLSSFPLPLRGSDREEGRRVLEVRKAGPWWFEMLAASRGEDTLASAAQ